MTLSPFDSLEPLKELFTNKKIVKLFHAASQDLEIIHHELGVLPEPIFDTQIAASLLGGTLQVGYGALVMSECGVKLKKADSFTDWSRRPLADSQIEYALDDVVYLPKMYRSMTAELERLGRLHWLDNDFAELSNPEKYIEDPNERWRRLRRVNQLSRRQLSAAREIAAWRETTAMKRDIPRKWICSDEQIVEACKREPRTLDDLFMVRGIRGALKMDDARSVLRACIAGLDGAQGIMARTAKTTEERSKRRRASRPAFVARKASRKGKRRRIRRAGVPMTISPKSHAATMTKPTCSRDGGARSSGTICSRS